MSDAGASAAGAALPQEGRAHLALGARRSPRGANVKPTGLVVWLQHAALGALGLALLGVAWWSAVHWFGAEGLAQDFGPGPVFEALGVVLQAPEVWTHLVVSLRRVGTGLALALVIGVPLGLAIGFSRVADALSSASIQFLRMISPLSWMPIVVMVLGVGDSAIAFLLGFAALWPMVLSTAAGVRQLDPRWLQLGRSLAANRRELLLHIILPGIIPNVLTGLRLALGISWIVLVPAEMLGVNAGLGYLILDTRDRLAYSELLATVLIVGALGLLLDWAARWVCQRAGAR